MLHSLHIENIAVIERTDITFDRGFNVLSGETGAGKSIVIDSLNAVLGERISRDIVRSGTPGAIVTALFGEMPDRLVGALRELGYEPDENGELLLERHLSADGKASARVNGRPVTVAVLRAIGRLLLNIHGQHENQVLLNADAHVDFLDRLGGLMPMREAYQAEYRAYREQKAALEALDTDEASKARRMDILRYQIDEIESADLHEGEEEELKARREIFRNSERIARSVGAARQFLSGDEDTSGSLVLLQQAVAMMTDAGRFMDDAAALSEKMQGLQYELDACADDLRALEDSLEFNEAERDAVETRCDLIRRLCTKYGDTTGDVLAFLEKCRAEYASIELSDAEQERLKTAVAQSLRRTNAAAAALTAARQKAAAAFGREVSEQLAFLDMPRVQLSVSIEPAALSATGADRVEFLLAANTGEPPRPLAKIASGGEMSRVMLALQTVLADVDDMETLVFDEIDTGVSGRAALKVGQKLHETAAGRSGTRRRQVLCVTHLAQIAAQADHHLLIEKAVHDGRTFTNVTALDESGRERELARIIGGEVTEAAIGAARELRREYGQNRA